MEPWFNSLEELKQRMMPALRIRKKELKRQSIHMTEEELWDYFANHYWKQASNLSLAKMVDDVLNNDVVLGDDVCEQK